MLLVYKNKSKKLLLFVIALAEQYHACMKRKIPVFMATQHPDNANAPAWNNEVPFISAHNELDECMRAFRDLGVDECMWDWEGKYADESVIDKLYSTESAFFKKHPLGKELFLTFRIPNVSKERGYSLVRSQNEAPPPFRGDTSHD
jgi:phosphoenolpyruvate carboxylase